MDFALDEHQEMLRKLARDFFDQELPRSLVKTMAQDRRSYSPELWTKMANVGFTGIGLPEEYGGSGGGFLDLMILMEEMGRACLPGYFFSTIFLGALVVADYGNQEQKQRILPKVVGGELLLTLAALEAGAIHDPGRFEVQATTKGKGFVINGKKLFVPDARFANYVICLAKTGIRELALFLVDGDNTGLVKTVLPTIAGDEQCELDFVNVEVPLEDVLGNIGSGREYYRRIYSKAAIAKCAEMVGGAQRVLDMSVSYAKERVQFGHPIGAFQAIQHYCADMLVDVETSRLMTWQAAWKVAQGLDCSPEVSMAKAWVNERYQRIAALGHQIHGTIGFQWDHDMHLYYKQAKLGAVTLGDTSYHEEIVAAALGL